MGYKNIQFFDDDDANLRLVKELETEYPDINLSTRHPFNKRP